MPGAQTRDGLPEQRFAASRRVAAIGAGVNLLLSAVKILIGIAGQSQALIADGIHSLSDLLTDGLVYFAARHARQAPDSEHPYGHGRFETMATMGLGAVLALVAAGIVWDGIERLFGVHELLEPTPLALYAAGFSILANEWLYRFTNRVARRINSDLLRANAWHHRSDSLSSVVVLLGVGGSLAAVIVGVMVAKIGWDLGWQAMQELVDAGLREERLAAIRDTILSVGGVRDLHMLRTRKLGGGACADVHVQVEPWLSVSEGHMISVLVERRLKEEIAEIDDVTVHVDPEDDTRGGSYGHLPPRAQALERLARAWQDVEGAQRRRRITLHYLGGSIHVDVYLPLEALTGREQAQRMGEELAGALASMPEFGTTRVFYG